MKNKACALVIGIFLSAYGFSQSIELPLFYTIKSDYYHQSAQNKDTIHLSYASLYSNELTSDSDFAFLKIDTLKDRSWGHRKLFDENFLILDKKNIYLTLDPIFNFSGGRDFSDSSKTTLYTNTRGILIQGVLGKNILFSTSFLENQARYPSYITSYVENTGVVPGMGRVKNFKDNAYDFSMATASITWDATSFLRIKLGNDKDYLGFGYRSVLLSDNAFNYPHLKIDLWFAKRKFKYTLNYALLQDLVRMPDGETPESLFERKMGAFHYLSYMPNRKISIGLFSGSILPQSSEDNVSNFYLDAFNPILLVNPIINNTNYINKMGLNFSWEIWKNGRMYFEFAENPANWEQYSVMVGFTTWDLLISNLNLTVEYSTIKESIYNKGIPELFSHYSQSLDHTLGTGFSELYTRLDYHYKRIHFLLSLNLASRYFHDAETWGFVNPNTNLPSEDAKGYVPSTVISSELSYLFNPKTNLNIALGYRMKRSGEYSAFGESDYLYIAFRTSLFNQYLDF